LRLDRGTAEITEDNLSPLVLESAPGRQDWGQWIAEYGNGLVQKKHRVLPYSP